MRKKLLINLLRDNSELPFYATKGAGSFDLKCCKIEMDGPNKAILYLGIGSEIPEGYVVTFKPRSSFTHKGWIMANSPAEIDSDYRGEWIVKMEAIPIDIEMSMPIAFTDKEPILKYAPLPYKVGDRVVQGKLERVEQCDIIQVATLSETERGTGGFGSTNK